MSVLAAERQTGAPAIERVRRMAAERDVLAAPFARAWPSVRRGDDAVIEGFARATLELADVNAGPACIAAFWREAANASDLRAVCAGAQACADICRAAGSGAALACLDALPVAVRLARGDAASAAAWWGALVRLAREAPLLVAGIAARAETVFADGDGFAFADFVAAGLKATARDFSARRAWFALEDARAKIMLARGGAAGFAQAERMLDAYVTGVWGGARLMAAPDGARRTNLAMGTIVLPPVYAGVAPGAVRALYRAAAAHAQAHLTVAAVRFPLGQLKPVQVVLIGLIEDARVEALAIRANPGLRRLWAAFHEARPGGVRTAAALMARAARALLDPAYEDDDGFVTRARALFDACDVRDPASSRAIGGLLGNDIGQMRLQFNARTYVTEPAYRCDNAHLWDRPDAPDEVPDAIAMTVEAARAAGGRGGEQAGDGASAPAARDAGMDDRGALLASYPEWDCSAGVERADWTSLRDTMPTLGVLLATDGVLDAAVRKLVRASAIGARARQPLRAEGEDLDLDAAIRAQAARRAGRTPDARVYRDRRPAARDLSTLIILDASQSTAATGADGLSVLEQQRRAVGALAAALDARGDAFALRAFASAGRDDVRLTRLKDFSEPMSADVMARLAGLRSTLSTRLGAALRHAGAELRPRPTTRKLALVLTDGEPSDIDADPRELIEDARRAVLGLRAGGVDVFGIVMDPAGVGAGATIFGRHNAVAVRRLEELPARLAGVYFRLARR